MKKVPIFITLAMILTLFVGCSSQDLETRVQVLTKENADLQAEVQNLTQIQALVRENEELKAQVMSLTQDKAALQQLVDNPGSGLKIDYLYTASNVTSVNGQLDWHKYEVQKSFIAGSSNGLWVVFGFSNILHDGKVNIKADIYIVSNGQIVDWKNNDASLTESTFNNLYWGDTFDISTIEAGEYTILLTINDIIAGTSATQKTAFIIEPSPQLVPGK